MSDPGRKSFTQQAKEKIVPDESKPISERIKEKVTDAADKVAAVVQPNETKSGPQKVFDTARGASKSQ